MFSAGSRQESLHSGIFPIRSAKQNFMLAHGLNGIRIINTYDNYCKQIGTKAAVGFAGPTRQQQRER
jgi:hypothetical protein